MKYLFRCDSSPEIGLGHLRRCVTLAGELKNRGASAVFACRSKGVDWRGIAGDDADDLARIDWDLSPGDDARETLRLCREKGASVAVVDHYRVDAEYQRLFRESRCRWMLFDWSARQPLWADWVVNASPAADESAYLKLRRRDGARLLLGPKYALLRPQFFEWRARSSFRDHVGRMLLTFGGGDDRGVAVFCLEALMGCDPSIERVMLMSSVNPRLAETRNWIEKNSARNVVLRVDERNVARLMADADIAVITGGGTAFEAAAMGLPSVIIHLADNQAPNAEAWDRRGAAVHLGIFGDVTAAALGRAAAALIEDASRRRAMSRAGHEKVDCRGAQRVATELLGTGGADDARG